MNTKNVLVVDDEATILKIISVELEEIGCIVDLSSDGEDALEKISKKRYDLAVIDRKLPKMDGLALLKKIKEANTDTVVIMMTAYGSINNAVEAMRIGAYDYLTKPFENSDLIDKIEEVFKIKERGGFSNKNFPVSNINFIGCSKESEYMRNKVEKIKNLDATVLITGESGTGKGVIAKLIHTSSNRSKMPYINVNCAVLPENLIESELFGHEKGAFTGAYKAQKGKFELAENGIIFLDEIGTLPLNLQAKLLNVLQDREIQRLGGTINIHIEARIIVATNINLEYAVKKRRFREDLYYRLNVISIECVPLRYRKDDLNPLIDFFVNKYNKKFKKNVKSISEEVKVLLHSYEWPGNVRELENTIESAIALSESNILYKMDLPSKISNQTKKLSKKKEEAFTLDEKLTPLEVQEIITIKEIVNKNNGHRVNSAKELGISRRTLQYKLKKYGLINWV
jgi:two-component system response regulator AtoC